MIIFKKIRWKNFLSTGNTPIEVDLPEPLLPTIKVVFDLFKFISIGVLPVDKKFLYLIFLKVITW